VTHRELAVLDALNIASTRYRRKGNDYEATAAQIAKVLNTDERIQGTVTIPRLTPVEVGASLRLLGQGHPTRRAPLVEKIDTRRWRLTDTGVSVLSA